MIKVLLAIALATVVTALAFATVLFIANRQRRQYHRESLYPIDDLNEDDNGEEALEVKDSRLKRVWLSFSFQLVRIALAFSFVLYQVGTNIKADSALAWTGWIILFPALALFGQGKKRTIFVTMLTIVTGAIWVAFWATQGVAK